MAGGGGGCNLPLENQFQWASVSRAKVVLGTNSVTHFGPSARCSWLAQYLFTNWNFHQKNLPPVWSGFVCGGGVNTRWWPCPGTRPEVSDPNRNYHFSDFPPFKVSPETAATISFKPGVPTLLTSFPGTFDSGYSYLPFTQIELINTVCYCSSGHSIV